MIWTEINPPGNFESWDAAKLTESRADNFSREVGKVLFENDSIILWEIVLKPSERLPFRRHVNNYSCTCFTDGLLLLRNINGKISLLRMSRGGHYYVECEDEEIVQDLENIGENTIKIAVVEEKLK